MGNTDADFFSLASDFAFVTNLSDFAGTDVKVRGKCCKDDITKYNFNEFVHINDVPTFEVIR